MEAAQLFGRQEIHHPLPRTERKDKDKSAGEHKIQLSNSQFLLFQTNHDDTITIQIYLGPPFPCKPRFIDHIEA